MEQEQTILSSVADMVTQQPVELEVDIAPRNRMHAVLQQWGILPKKKVLVIRPIYYGTLIRISQLLLGIDMSKYDISHVHESNYTIIRDHGIAIATIIAEAIHNRRSAAPERLVSFIMDNFTNKELLSTLLIVLQQMNIKDFMTSIISVRGMNVLERKTASAKIAENNEVSPMDQGS